MTTYVAVVLVIVSRVVFGAGWVKVANFYRHTQTDLLTGYEKSGEDLIVLLVDTVCKYHYVESVLWNSLTRFTYYFIFDRVSIIWSKFYI